MSEKRKCPICKGSGELDPPHIEKKDQTIANAQIVKTLRDAGYSFRQIQKAMGFESVRSVQYLLEKK